MVMELISSEFEPGKREAMTRTISFKRKGLNETKKLEESTRSARRKLGNHLTVETTSLAMSQTPEFKDNGVARESKDWLSPKQSSDLNAAATKLQKVYKSYRTRRNLADCAVVVEELWWKALDFAALKRSSVSFFDSHRSETAISRWARARTRVAKVGKGLSKCGKAQKLALRHWLEAIDPRHRYGHNLHLYYEEWLNSESFEPFFYWLDIGNGKEVSLEKCPRTVLQHQCIKYLGPIEREAYEVIVANGKLVYKQIGELVDTPEGAKWIFVLSTSMKLYVAEKKKGRFQHSSFLAGGATISAGRLFACDGVLEAVWAYSGHYCPTEENFKDFISFLEEHHVDLTNVKKFAIDDDIPPSNKIKIKLSSESQRSIEISKIEFDQNSQHIEVRSGKCLSGKWTSGAGPRISCVREYPTQLQFQALERVNQSPRARPNVPIPSPRPSPKVILSPGAACIGLQSPRVNASNLNQSR